MVGNFIAFFDCPPQPLSGRISSVEITTRTANIFPLNGCIKIEANFVSFYFNPCLILISTCTLCGSSKCEQLSNVYGKSKIKDDGYGFLIILNGSPLQHMGGFSALAILQWPARYCPDWNHSALCSVTALLFHAFFNFFFTCHWEHQLSIGSFWSTPGCPKISKVF